MATLKKYDFSGKEVGSLSIDEEKLEVKAHLQSMKDYLVAMRKNARQWSAHTKTRAEIQRTGRKPHPQKGGGRSRQGDLAAPQYKGGGIVFGPRKKEGIHVRINQKEKRAAIRFLLAEKIRQGDAVVLQDPDMKEPKTKKVGHFLDQLNIRDKRVLFLVDGKAGKREEHLVKSLRNIPKKEFSPVSQLNGYQLAKAKGLVILESAAEDVLSMLGVS